MGACVARDICLTRDELQPGSYFTKTPAHFTDRTGSSASLGSPGRSSPGVARGCDEPYDPDHKLEWAIVGKSIEESELKSLRLFAARVEDLDDHEACRSKPWGRQPQVLLRYLRARDSNVDKAERMFRDMLDWRLSMRVDEKMESWRRECEEMRTRTAKLVKRYTPEADICLDKYGIPVKLVRLGVADVAGSVRELGKETILVDSLVRLEEAHAQIRLAMFRHKTLLRGQIQIIDVGDYGQWNGLENWSGRMWGAFMNGREIYKVFDLNYPETVRAVFIVRTGTLTNRLWTVAKPLVPARTLKKLRIFGLKAQEWVGELRAELGEKQELPLFLECDTDHAFATAEPRGGLVPMGAATAAWDPEVARPGRLALPIAARRAKAHVEAPSGSRPRPLMAIALLLAAVAVLAADASAREWLFNGFKGSHEAGARS